MSHRYQVDLEPVDPILFGDNRSARAGFDHLQLDQDPSPLTLYGAIGGELARRAAPAGPWPEALLGPEEPDILDRVHPHRETTALLGYAFCDPAGEQWFPKPLHARVAVDEQARLWPIDLLRPEAQGRYASSVSTLGFGAVLSASRPTAFDECDEALLVDGRALGNILTGSWSAAAAAAARLSRPADVYRHEARAGVGIDNARGVAQQGLLFTRPYRRFQPAGPHDAADRVGWGFRAWVSTPGEVGAAVTDGLAFIAGDRRRARFRIEAKPEPLTELRDAVIAAARRGGAGFVAYLLTPRIATTSQPTLAAGAPIAAAIGKPRWSSGWNVAARAPRKITTLVPAGSVYFYEWRESSPETREQLVREHWLSSLGPGAEAGFGRILIGVWQ